jgi:hypothetical protein
VLRSLTSIAAVFGALAGAGCGASPPPEYTDLTGTVTRDGKPVPGVVVTFDPAPGPAEKGTRADGLTDANGVYRLRTGTPARDGVAAGVYRVTLKPTNLSAGVRSAAVPREYTIPSRSPLGSVVVEGGTQNFDIALVASRTAAKRP